MVHFIGDTMQTSDIDEHVLHASLALFCLPAMIFSAYKMTMMKTIRPRHQSWKKERTSWGLLEAWAFETESCSRRYFRHLETAAPRYKSPRSAAEQRSI